MARSNRNGGGNRRTDSTTPEEALTSDERRSLSPEVENVRDQFFGDDPAADERAGGRR